MFPTMGSFHGPRGTFEAEPLVLELFTSIFITINMKRTKEESVEHNTREKIMYLLLL